MVLTFTSEIKEKQMLTEDVMKIKFSAPDNFYFKAGQFINIKCEKDEEQKRKSYSILNPPSEKRIIDVCIKIIQNGFASNIWEKSKPGDKFEIKGPFGNFTFDEQTENEHWFLCAGTGVTPAYSIIKENLKTGKKMALLFGVRFKKNLFLHKEFQEMERSHKNFTYLPVLSREKWNGLRGHVQDNLPENLKGKTFYLSGLKELVVEAEELLNKKGVKKEYIHKERYS